MRFSALRLMAAEVAVLVHRLTLRLVRPHSNLVFKALGGAGGGVDVCDRMRKRRRGGGNHWDGGPASERPEMLWLIDGKVGRVLNDRVHVRRGGGSKLKREHRAQWGQRGHGDPVVKRWRARHQIHRLLVMGGRSKSPWASCDVDDDELEDLVGRGHRKRQDRIAEDDVLTLGGEGVMGRGYSDDWDDRAFASANFGRGAA
jgi:hypothetical protein